MYELNACVSPVAATAMIKFEDQSSVSADGLHTLTKAAPAR